MKTTLTPQSQSVSKRSLDYLIDHILGGYRSSHEGIVYAKKKGLLTAEEVADLLAKNGERLISRIIEFKIVERTMCIFFALLFGFMQITGNDLDMRRTRARVRVRRRTEQYQPLLDE